MGRPKLTMPCGNSTVIECVLDAVRAAGVDEVLVVVAPDGEDIAQLAAHTGAHVLRLPYDTPDMRSTCEHGLAWIENAVMPRTTTAGCSCRRIILPCGPCRSRYFDAAPEHRLSCLRIEAA